MKSLVIAIAIAIALALVSCTSSSPATGPRPVAYPEAQAVVDKVAAKHPDVLRLTIHAVPRSESRSRVVASSVPAKLDDWSDPEDLRAMETKQPVTLREGAHLDYTAPVVDRSGKAIAAVGVTVRGTDEGAMLANAQGIAKEVTDAILASGKPLW